MRLNKQGSGERKRDHRREKRGLKEGQEANGTINGLAAYIYSVSLKREKRPDINN